MEGSEDRFRRNHFNREEARHRAGDNRETYRYSWDFGSTGQQTMDDFSNGTNTGKNERIRKVIADYIRNTYGPNALRKFLQMVEDQMKNQPKEDPEWSEAKHNPWASKMAGWNESFNDHWFWMNGHTTGQCVKITGIKTTVTISNNIMPWVCRGIQEDIAEKWHALHITAFEELEYNAQTKEYW